MCRWIAYIGQPIFMDTLVTRPEHSLVTQSLETKMRYKPDGSILSVNGDGFGIGWFNQKKNPGLYKVSEPAWSNENIHSICSQTKSHLFMAHIREATSGEVHRSNTHPFIYKNWLFQHNGCINGFKAIYRELCFDIQPELFPLLRGNTDSEVFFFLALTFGLEKDPKSAIEKTLKHILKVCEKNNMPFEISLSIAFSNGKALYTCSFSSAQETNSQYYSTDSNCMLRNSKKSSKGIVVVSEPLDYSAGNWHEMPEQSFCKIHDNNFDYQTLSV